VAFSATQPSSALSAGPALRYDASNSATWSLGLLEFEWDSAKAEANIAKHGVSFEEAASAFGDFRSVTIRDDHLSEARFVLLGRATSGRLLVVVHADREDAIRIISARKATKHETKSYGHG
jgi:uncharacterized DUF497 family protein